jgi:hypothetical protein
LWLCFFAACLLARLLAWVVILCDTI